MGVTVESLKKPAIVGAYSTTDTVFTLDSAVQNTSGYGTLNEGGAQEEIIKWTGKSGNDITGCLRGLSLTALTDTEIVGNKKTHANGEVLTVGNVHYIINDKASKSSAETITGVYTFQSAVPKSDTAASATQELMRYDETVRTSDNQTIAGEKTFSDVPLTTGGDPTVDNELARKKYVDDRTSEVADTIYAGEAISQGEAVALEPLDNTDGGSNADFGRDAASNGVKQAQSFIAGSVPSSFSMTASLQKVGSPTDNIFISIETDNAGEPSGTQVTNGQSNDVAGSGLSASYTDVAFTWGSVPTLVAGTRYWFVIQRDGANSDVNYYQAEYASNNAFRSGQMKKFTTSWTTNTGNDDDVVFAMSGVNSTITLTDTLTANSNRQELNFIGFASDAIAEGATGTIVTNGLVTSGLSGLSDGSEYFASSTPGAITTTKSPKALILGLASKDDELYIVRSRKTALISVGAGDQGKVPELDSNGEIDSGFIDTGVTNGQICQFDGTGYPAADGSQITNISTNVALATGTRASGASSGNEDISSLGFQAKYVIIKASVDGGGTSASDGFSNGTTHYAMVWNDTTPSWNVNTSVALNVVSGGNGWTATISLIAGGFRIVWTKVNTGLNVRYVAYAVR